MPSAPTHPEGCDPANQPADRRLANVTIGCAAAAVILSGCVLIGWAFDLRPLKSLADGWPDMAPLTAVEFALSAIALACLVLTAEATPGLRRASQLLGILIASVALARLCLYVIGATFAPDLLGFRTGGAATADNVARMAPLTATAFALLGTGLWQATRLQAVALAQSLGFCGSAIALLGLSRYVFGGEPLFPYGNMALHTSVGLLVLNVGLLSARSDSGAMALLLSDSAGGLLARRLLLPAVLLPFLIGWLRLEGQLAGLYDMRTGLTLFVLTNALAFAALVLTTAKLLHRSELQQRSLDRAVQEHRDRLASIITTEPECVKVVDGAGRLLEMNPAGLSMLEVHSLEEAQTCSLADFILPEHRAAFVELHQRVMRGSSGTLEFEIAGRRGTTRWLETHAVPLRDPRGTSYALLGITRDISARKRVDSTLAQVKLFRELLDYSSDLIYVADAHTRRIIDCNAALPERLGYTREEVLRMEVPDFTRTDISISEWDTRIATLQASGPLMIERDYRCRDGATLPVEVNLRYVELRGRPVLFAIVRDLSERKLADAKQRETQRLLHAATRKVIEAQEDERRRLARELHDTVGQELTALALNLTIIRGGIPNPLAAGIEQRMNDTQVLIEETTEHVRRVMTELRPAGLDELGLTAALREHAERVAARCGLRLTVNGTEPNPRLPPTVTIALFRISQEALNNTVKHAQATEAIVELGEEDGIVRLKISDNGKGMSSQPNKRSSGSFGMGMTTMRERAESIGARLSVSSEVGVGTSLCVELPRSAVPVSETLSAAQGGT